MPTTELLRRADARVHAIPVPTRSTVFIPGDVWPADTVRALIDWKTAGVGNPGVDLGELGKQVAIAYGEEAPNTCWTAGNEPLVLQPSTCRCGTPQQR
jgi:aminoglycoside phosphotransferase (APT) family kinase protein